MSTFSHHVDPNLAWQRARRLLVWAVCALCVMAAACDRKPPVVAGAATEPAQAVALLSQHLRQNDLSAFVRDAVPSELRPGLEAAWQSGQSRWPLDELPFDRKLPGVLAELSGPQAEKKLRRTFDWQFAHANGEIRSAVIALGLFAVKYLQSDPALSDDERAHYVQIVPAVRDWAAGAKLGDPKRAHRGIAQLVAAARQTGLHDEAAFGRYGMDESLRRLGPFMAAFKRVTQDYGLDFDASLDSMQVSLETQDGDRARVRMRYRLADEDIDTVVGVERVQGRWYISDFLRHAREVAAAAAPAPAAPGAGKDTPPQAATPAGPT